MKSTGTGFYAMVGLALLGLAPLQAQAALTYFADRPTFNAAAPSLTLETFENGTPNVSFLSPLDSTTSNAAISPGDIVPGVRFASTEASNPLLQLTNVFGTTSSQILLKGLESPGGSSIDISFPGAHVLAVGLDLYLVLPPLTAANTTISIFGDGGLLATQIVTTSTSAGGVFFGVVSSGDSIRRINVDGVLPGFFSFEGIDNVAFAAVPEPGTLALLSLGLAGLAASRRRKQ